MNYRHVLVAGTLEGLHKGHRVLLRRAFTEGRKVTVGVTSDQFVKKFKIKNVELKINDYVTRKRVLEDWLQENHLAGRATIIPIDDPYEPAVSMAHLDALIVTRENRKIGEHINDLRQGSTLSPLVIIEVSMVSAEDGVPISSTRMRHGEIDREGSLVMPESLRSLLAKPLGTVLTGQQIALSLQQNKGKTIITVGDVATKTLLDQKVTPVLAIIDFRVARKPYKKLTHYVNTLVLHSTRVKSGPGYISRQAKEAIERWSENALVKDQLFKVEVSVIVVDGEEDLLVLPVVLSVPLGSVIYYGQPRLSRDKLHGLVEVIVTKAMKQNALALIAQFLS